MIIVGDIGNTETKVCLIDKSNKIIKKIIIKTKDINNNSLSVLFTKFKLSKINIKKVLFCSVVPKAFNQIKKIDKENQNVIISLDYVKNLKDFVTSLLRLFKDIVETYVEQKYYLKKNFDSKKQYDNDKLAKFISKYQDS